MAISFPDCVWVFFVCVCKEQGHSLGSDKLGYLL